MYQATSLVVVAPGVITLELKASAITPRAMLATCGLPVILATDPLHPLHESISLAAQKAPEGSVLCLAGTADEQAAAQLAIAEAPKEPVPAPEATQETPEPAEVPQPLIGDEAWIEQQNPDHYTIQVMALADRSVIEGLLEPFEAFAPFAIYTVQKSTNPLHVLVQGSYPDVDSARAAQARFPRKIQRRDRLWIRRFEMVQKLLE